MHDNDVETTIVVGDTFDYAPEVETAEVHCERAEPDIFRQQRPSLVGAKRDDLFALFVSRDHHITTPPEPSPA